MGTAGEGKRILYIEDEPEMARLVALMLEAEGYAVIEAQRGTRGLDFLYESFPHLVLLDLRMTVMSGYEFLEAMKAQSGLREIPVICVTGLSGLDKIQEAFLRGADGYVIKPIEFDFLAAMVAFLSSRERLEEKAGLLLPLAGMREAAMMAGYGVDSLEKADVLLALEDEGEEGCAFHELPSRLLLRHEGLEAEVRGLMEAGALLQSGEEMRLRLNAEGGWRARSAEIRRLLRDKVPLQAFVNGAYTGVLAHALSVGYFD